MSCKRAGSGSSVLSDGSRKRETVCGIGAARGQHAAEQLRQAMRLGDGRGNEGAAGIEPLDPAEAARRALHAEQRGVRLGFRRSEFEGCRHVTLAPKERV